MASSDYLPTKDGDIISWAENFIAVANGNLAALGLIAGDITSLTTKKSDYSTGLNNAIAKQIESKSATDNKNAKRGLLTDNIRTIARQIQARPGVPDDMKVKLGLKSSTPTPSPTNPLPPESLSLGVVTGLTVRLKWNRNGNAARTIFIIEASNNPDINYTMIGTTTKSVMDTSYRTETGATFFRVKAQKGDQISDSSNVVTV